MRIILAATLLFIAFCGTLRATEPITAAIDFWKPAYAQIQKPTIIGKWISGNTIYSCNADGTGELSIAEKSTSSFQWKQRDDHKVYIDGYWINTKGNMKSEFRYAGYTKSGAFVRDELDYEDKYSKVP